MPDVSRRRISSTAIHIMALDGVVNVNSLFTLALFLGLAWYPTTSPQNALVGGDTSCVAGSSIAEDLITSHIYSFSCFLFSSLIALALKQAIYFTKASSDPLSGSALSSFVGRVSIAALRGGIFVSALGSVFGCGFLMMALVDLVQIKLGTLECGSYYTIYAIVPLLVLAPLALVIYILLVLYAFAR